MKKKIIGILIGMTLMLPLLSVSATANQPPDIPEISGPTEVEIYEENEFTFVTTDPEGDDVYYWIEWAPCCFIDFAWHGPYASGEEAVISYAYECDGEHIMRVKAKDIYDAESDWATFELTAPFRYIFPNSFINRILEMFPNAFPILRYLLGL